MRKRIIVIALILLVAISLSATADTFGIGAAFSLSALGGLPSSAMVSLKLPQLPVLWGIAAQFGNGEFNMGMTADWWLYQQRLVSFIGLYVGPGLYMSLPQPFEIGGRVPIGLNAYPLDFLELFIEVAPALVIYSTATGFDFPNFRVQGALGLRFWFDL